MWYTKKKPKKPTTTTKNKTKTITTRNLVTNEQNVHLWAGTV